jgi:MYXO-CTERM domain-containing protein
MLVARRAGIMVAASVSALSALLGSRPAHACECVGSEDARDFAAQADVVFEGQLERVDVRAEVTFNHFRVFRYWKGNLDAEVAVITDGGEACGIGVVNSCAERFAEGERHLVFAKYESYCAPRTALCRGTRAADGAEEAFSQLGSSALPGSGPGPLDDSAPAAPANDCVNPPEVGPCPDAGFGGAGGTLQIPADASPPPSRGAGGAPVAPDAGAHDDLQLREAQSNDDGGCGCRAARGSSRPWSLVALGVSLLAIVRRRR